MKTECDETHKKINCKRDYDNYFTNILKIIYLILLIIILSFFIWSII